MSNERLTVTPRLGASQAPTEGQGHAPQHSTAAGQATRAAPARLCLPGPARQQGPQAPCCHPSAWLSKLPRTAQEQISSASMCKCFLQVAGAQLTRTPVKQSTSKKKTQESQHTQSWATDILLHPGHQGCQQSQGHGGVLGVAAGLTQSFWFGTQHGGVSIPIATHLTLSSQA